MAVTTTLNVGEGFIGQSGWELEMLEAEAMDSEEETEDAGEKVTEQRGIADSRSVRGEMSVTVSSGSLVDPRNLGLKKNILTAMPSEFSVNDQLISTPHKEICSARATSIFDTKRQALEVNRSIAEQLPASHGVDIINGKQPNPPDVVDLSMKCNGLSSNARNSSVGMTSCEEDMNLGSLGCSRRSIEKVISPKEQFNNLWSPHKEKPEEVNKGDFNISSAESIDEASRKCTYHKLNSSMTSLNKPYAEGQAHVLSKKRKLSVSKFNSKSMNSDQDSRTSGLLDAPKKIDSADLDFLKSQRQELDNIVAHTETTTSMCQMAEDNHKFHQLERLSVSSASLRSPELAQRDSGTCIKQSPSTSMKPRQIEYLNATHSDIDHGLEGPSFVQPRANQHGPVSKSSSLTFKRKFLKPSHSASIANISTNSSSMSDNKDALLSVPSKPALDETVCTTGEPLSGVGNMCDISSSEGMVFSDCPLNNETGLPGDRTMGNDASFLRSTLAGGSGNVNEAPFSVKLFDTPLKRARKSEADVKSQNFDSVSLKCKTDIHSEASEQNEKSDEDQEVFSNALKDTKIKGSGTTETRGSGKKDKANVASIGCNREVLVSRNMGCRPKPIRGNCSNKTSNSLRSINSNKAAIKLGNGILELGDVENLKEKVEKEGSPMKGKGKAEQCFQPASNSNVNTVDTNYQDPEKQNELKKICSLSVKADGDCGQKAKKISKSNLTVKRSSGDNSDSLPKLSCSSAVIEPMRFILSGHQTQRREFQKIIKRLRGRICKDSHSWSYEATHFIVPDYVRRTQKFFAAAAAGRWILKSDYLTASDEAGKFLDEEPFEWHKKGLTEDGAVSLEAPRKWRTLRERTGHGAFYGMRVIIYGECIAPPLDTLKRAVKAGDGAILATSPPFTRFLKSGIDFAIVNLSMPIIDVWVQEFLRHEIPCVLPDYLVEYICKPGYSLEKHVLYNTHKWAEKSLSNLLSRAEEAVSDESSAEEGLSDIQCVVCGSEDREEVMLICGDEARALGCGVGTHIDCCDPPLVEVPEDDWFCSGCSRKMGKKATQAKD